MRKIDKIFVHHSASSQRKTTRDMIDRWHKDRGWAGIGYHYVIHADGSMHIGRLLTKVGAHCRGHNKHSIGICVAGNYEDDKNMTLHQNQSLSLLLFGLLDQYNLGVESVYGHREFGNSLCPGEHLFSWLQKWREDVKSKDKDKDKEEGFE